MTRNSYNDYKIDFTEDCIFGQIGLSISLDSVILIANAVFNYCNSKGIQATVIGFDSSKWSETFALRVLSERLVELGLKCHIVPHSCSSSVLSWATNRVWLDSEKSQETLGLYFSTDETQQETLSIKFCDNQGLPLTEEKVAEIGAQSFKVHLIELNEMEQGRPEPIDTSRYITAFKNTKLLDVKSVKGQILSIDNMFGPSEDLVQQLRKEFLFQGQLVNKASENLRINNYKSLPSGKWLQWKVPGAEHSLSKTKRSYLHSAVGNTGGQLGVWDLRQNIEISPSGIFMIFLKYFAEVKKKKGTIIISKALSDKVEATAKHYKFKTVLVDSGPSAFSKAYSEVGKKSALMYGDEFGGFWFKGQPLDANAIVSVLLLLQICDAYKLSPGQIIDHMSKKILKRQYIYGKMYVPASVRSKSNLEDTIRRDVAIKNEEIGATSVFRATNGTKISLVYSKKTDVTVIEVESLDATVTREIIQSLETTCFGQEKNNEVENSTP